MTCQSLRKKCVIILLLSIFDTSVCLSSGGIEQESTRQNPCCWMSVDGEAKCCNRRFISFPPFPPPEDGSPEWCGTKGNAKIFERENVTKFTVTNVTITSFNKEALRQFRNLEEIVFSDSSLPLLKGKLFFFKEREGQSKVLRLSICQSKIKRIAADAFYDLHALKKLSLGGNHLKGLPSGVFDHLPNLRYLYLSGNQLSNLNPAIFKNLLNLQELHLSHNPLTSVGTFPRLPQLRSLYLKSASLNVIDTDAFSHLDGLSTFDLSQNRLKSLPSKVFSENRFLERIYLKNNILEDLPGEAFSSLCNLKSLDLRYNRLTTPKVAYMASIFENRNDPQGTDLGSHDLIGNPWKCNDTSEDLKEYALFVSMVYHNKQTQNVLHGLPNYTNIVCSETGQFLVNPSTMSSPVLNHLTEARRGELLERNDCPHLELGIPKNPACPFISPTCNGTKIVVTPPMELMTQDGVPTHYFFIGGGLLAVIVVLGVCNHRSRYPVKRRKRFLTAPSPSVDPSSFLSTLRSSDVTISEETISRSQEAPIPNTEMKFQPNSSRISHPVSPLAPDSFSFSKSESNTTLSENEQHDNAIDDVNTDTASVHSETEAKEIYQRDDSGRISPNLTHPKHAHLAKQNDFEGQNNVYEKSGLKQSFLPDNSGYAAAARIPSGNPRTMPGYEVMRPIRGVCYVGMDDELLPCNLYRALPSFPQEHSVMSQHLYESINSFPAPQSSTLVNQVRESELTSEFEMNPPHHLPPHEFVNINKHCIVSNNASQAPLFSRLVEFHKPQTPGIICPEDQESYLMPYIAQHHLQTANFRSQNSRNFITGEPIEGTNGHDSTPPQAANYSTFIEDGKEYILPNMESTAKESDGLRPPSPRESQNLGQHETTTYDERHFQDHDARERDVAAESVYLFSEETSLPTDKAHSHRHDRPVSQQPLIENMD